VINISADGQDPPSIINRMLEEHFEGRHEIVVFTREGRDESAYRVWTSRVFYSLMRRLSFPNLPAGGFDCVLLGRKALQILLANREVHPFYQGQILWLGFEPRILGYRRLQRQVGTSRWTFARKVTYLIDGVVSYSHLPIRLISLAGIVVALLGFLYAALIFVLRLVYGNPIQGWAPLMIVILVMGGLQMLMLGAIGEYVWRTLAQARGRDAYVIDEVHDGSE
jgi:dolichol-phosphate mannosyltransferase